MNALPQNLHDALAQDGHARLPAAALRPLLEQGRALADWARFADSWAHLEVDGHMADQGRYRRRRHAHYQLMRSGEATRLPHAPHWQSLDYNPLNGGIQRWFEPVEEVIGEGDSLRRILLFCAAAFAPLAPAVQQWAVEVHQFRIEARAGEPGLPTPEGVHRDGVDCVLVLLVRRENIASGITEIFTPQGERLGSFTLTEPLDAVLIDDHRVHHGVTAVVPVDPARPAYRDVLVVTLRRT